MTDVVVITGIRELAPASHEAVEDHVRQACAGASLMIFGGALGVDTVALVAAGQRLQAGPPERLVIVPFTREAQPREAKAAIRGYAHSVLELQLPFGRTAYLRRNVAMIEHGAARALATQQRMRLLAFTDGRPGGGTAYTIREARRRGITPEVVSVQCRR